MALRIGVDVGGTNTDAAVLSAGNHVIGSCKVLATADVLQGVQAAIKGALDNAGVGADQIASIGLGTTAFVNALVTGQGLARVAAVRLCGPATRALPPFCDLPPALWGAIVGRAYLVAGGYEYDGRREISRLDESDLRGVMRDALRRGIRCFAVSGVFSPVNDSQEERAASMLRVAAEELLGAEVAAAHVHICLSHRIGSLGLLERENATVLNAALLPLARRIVPACRRAVRAAGIAGHLRFASNDGTLISADDAMQLPVATYQSGPVNSLRGAGALTGLTDAIVVDVGGTSTDVGVLVNGLPLPAARRAEMAGVAVNFEMPDTYSISLGGGSLVDPAPLGSVPRIGPASVGNQLLQRAVSFGGTDLTATDLAVRLGRLRLGDASLVAARLSQQQAGAAWEEVQAMVQACIDRMRTSAEEVAVVVVGGGAALCGGHFAGASRVVVPEHADVANAIGAAILQVSGRVDRIADMGDTAATRAAAWAAAEENAAALALRAGAVPGTCALASKEEIPLAYLPGHRSRLKCRVVGDLDPGGTAPAPEEAALPPAASPGTGLPLADDAKAGPLEPAASERPEAAELPGRPEAPSARQLAEWTPQVGPNGWTLHADDLYLIAAGTGILGCGGGGSPGPALLKALLRLQRSPGSMRVVPVAAVPDAGVVVDAGYMGAPTVGYEKLESSQAEAAVATVLEARACCAKGDSPARLTAVIAGEIGGGNGLEGLVVGAGLGAPIVDGDFMGRAFPELQMMTTAIYGAPLTPVALVDEKGNALVVRSVAEPAWLERLLRPACDQMGCSAGFASAPLTGAQLRKAAAAARHAKRDAARAIADAGGGTVLFRGRVTDVERATTEGFARGVFRVAGLEAPHLAQTLEVQFQNENLVARLDGALVACVPDLICCVETASGASVATEELRYGLLLSVVALPAHPLLRTPRGLEVVGPAAFGLVGLSYRPVGEYRAPAPVVG